MRNLIIPAVALSLATPALAQTATGLTASEPAPSSSTSWSTDARLSAPVDASLLPTNAAQNALPQRRASGAARALVPMTIGAVLGSWVGYVASQVTRSDWDKESNSEFNSYRLGFAAGGAAVGAVTGLIIGNNLGGGSSGSTPRVLAPDNRTLISNEEIQGSRARNALELIQSLRPRWLSSRGVNSTRETTRGTGTGEGSQARVEVTQVGESSIKVYMDNNLMGDVSVLRTVGVGSFTEVRYFDSAQATNRWGAGHMGGAIELITRPVTQ
jgi:hypothetical protein